MKPWEKLGETTTPDGKSLTLNRRDTEYTIMAAGECLMSSRMPGSGEAMATVACEGLRRAESPCVLVGGLGMGFTLRAALDILPPTATVVVSEMFPAVVDWNRGPLADLARRPLDDARVQVEAQDVLVTLRAHPDRFDAVLLDVDNGPAPFATSSNGALYGQTGLFAVRTALTFGGILAVWSAWHEKHFPQRLRFVGFTNVTVHRVRARLARGGSRHTIFIAHNGEA